MSFSDAQIFHDQVDELKNKRDSPLNKGFVPTDKEELRIAINEMKENKFNSK